MTQDGPDDPTRRTREGILARGVANMRQLMQPPAYRIAAPAPCERTSRPPTVDGGEAGVVKGGESLVPEERTMQTLASVATALWRARTKLTEDAQANLPPELRHLPRHIHAAWDALTAGGVQVEDPTGQQYVAGMAVNVLTFQPLEGIDCDTIHETIKPAVYCDDKLIQRADIIVARPPQDSEIHDGQLATDGDDAIADDIASDKQGPDAHGSHND